MVLQEEQPAAMSELLLEMERARMSREDYRGAMESPYGNNPDTRDPNYRRLSWREFGEIRVTHLDQVCDQLATVIAEARHALGEARAYIRHALDDPGSDRRARTVALTVAYNAMVDAERTLYDDDSASLSDEEDADGEEGADEFEG